ncbi:MAG: hypothetical protein ACLRSW_14905 [Christensenellaceae bacterium]
MGNFTKSVIFRPRLRKCGYPLWAEETTIFGTDQLFADINLSERKSLTEVRGSLAGIPPSVRHTAAGATIVVNLSASDETVGKAEY